jgi:hypothetical protein
VIDSNKAMGIQMRNTILIAAIAVLSTNAYAGQSLVWLRTKIRRSNQLKGPTSRRRPQLLNRRHQRQRVRPRQRRLTNPQNGLSRKNST